MNMIQKSETIKNGLRKGFQDGSSKMAHRKCYGYKTCSDGELAVNPEEAKIVRWIFERYLYTGTHKTIISDDMFAAVQQEKLSRSKEPKTMLP